MVSIYKRNVKIVFLVLLTIALASCGNSNEKKYDKLIDLAIDKFIDENFQPSANYLGNIRNVSDITIWEDGKYIKIFIPEQEEEICYIGKFGGFYKYENGDLYEVSHDERKFLEEESEPDYTINGDITNITDNKLTYDELINLAIDKFKKDNTFAENDYGEDIRNTSDITIWEDGKYLKLVLYDLSKEDETETTYFMMGNNGFYSQLVGSFELVFDRIEEKEPDYIEEKGKIIKQ